MLQTAIEGVKLQQNHEIHNKYEPTNSLAEENKRLKEQVRYEREKSINMSRRVSQERITSLEFKLSKAETKLE